MKRQANNQHRNGFVLITVLLLTVLLAAVVLAFHQISRVSVCRAGEYYHQKQATYYAAGGVQNFLAMLSERKGREDARGLDYEAEGSREFRFGEGGCDIEWTLENGKLNVNSLKEKNGGVNRAVVEQLLRLIDQWNQSGRADPPPLSYGLAASLIDWIDADDTVTVLSYVKGENRGAEAVDYPAGRGCRNGPLESLGELGYVRYGGVGLIGGGKSDRAAKEGLTSLAEVLTIYGDDKIAINAANAAVIQSLSEGIPAELARGVVEARNRKPFSSMEDVKNVPGMTAELADAILHRITFRPKVMYYRVTAIGYMGEGRVKVSAVIRHDLQRERPEVIRYLEEEMEDTGSRSDSR